MAGLLLVCVGCSSNNSRVQQPAYSSDAGKAACSAYDTNKDGAIAGEELNRVPGLRTAMAQIDGNRDKRITADEIDARVAQWVESKIGEMPVRCLVTLDDQPLVDAEVVFEPETFLGSNIKPARGKTGPTGVAGISLAKEHLADPQYAGMACGWYKIKVTSSSKSIPSIYNTDTTLGCEVAMDAHWVNDGEIKIAMKSK